MVVLQEMKDMFWALTLEAGKRYSQTVKKAFHLSMAALEDTTTKHKDGMVAVMVSKEKAEFLLCSLRHKNLFNQPLDLNFTEGEEVTFFINGDGNVHLTGYQLEDERDDFDGFDMSDEDEDDSDEAPELVPAKGAKRKSAVDDKNAKKMKVSQLDDLSDDDDEDDEDDDDYEGLSFIDDEADDDDDEDEMEDSEEEEEVKPKKKEAKKDKKQQPPQTPSTPSVQESGDASESAKKKKKKKKKKNKNQETPEKPGQGQQTPAQKQKIEGQAKTPKDGAKTPKDQAKTPKEQGKTPKEQTKTPKEQGKTPKKQVLAGGIVMEDFNAGNGPTAQKGKMVHVYYVGKLQKDGKQFDSCSSGKPFKFRLGAREVIAGWDKGLEGMKVGGKRRLIVPPKEGYGNQKQGPIPANSTLIFDIELKSVT